MVAALLHGLRGKQQLAQRKLVLPAPRAVGPSVKAAVLLVFAHQNFYFLPVGKAGPVHHTARKGTLAPAHFLVDASRFNVALVARKRGGSNGVPRVAVKQHVAVVAGVGAHREVRHFLPVDAAQLHAQGSQSRGQGGVHVHAQVEEQVSAQISLHAVGRTPGVVQELKCVQIHAEGGAGARLSGDVHHQGGKLAVVAHKELPRKHLPGGQVGVVPRQVSVGHELPKKAVGVEGPQARRFHFGKIPYGI